MQTRRLSPVFLACAATFSLLSFQANAQTLSLTNNSSLSKGMTPKAVRTYETNKATKGAGGKGVSGQSPDAGGVAGVGTGTGETNNNGTNGGPYNGTNGGPNNGTNIGTNGAGGGTGSSNNSTITGSGGDFMGPPSPNQYNGNGGVTNTGGDFMGPPSPNGLGGLSGAIPGTVVSGIPGVGGLATNGQTTPDWLRMIQVAAPVVAGITGNQNVANVASIAGSGAQLYGQLSNGQDWTLQNYANMGNIALQTAALATNNPNIDRAVQLGNLGTGAWNAYTALSGGSNTAGGMNAGGAAQFVGYTPSGQPVYQSAQQATQSGSTPWGAVANVAGNIAPQLGNITGNRMIGQVGAVAGLAGNVYNQTGGFNNSPTMGQVANVAGQLGYATGNQGLGQVGQVANAAGQINNGYTQGQQTYNPGNSGTVNYAQPATQSTNGVYQSPKPVYDNVTGEQVLPGTPEYQAATATPMPKPQLVDDAYSNPTPMPKPQPVDASSTPKATQAEIDRFNSPLYAKPVSNGSSSSSDWL